MQQFENFAGRIAPLIWRKQTTRPGLGHPDLAVEAATE
jgi:hypothetical protein